MPPGGGRKLRPYDGEEALRTCTRTFEDFTSSAALGEASGRDGVDGGLRCAVSTPLMTRAGVPIGVLTVFWKTPHAATDRELRFLDLLVRQAADAVERQHGMGTLRANVDLLQRFNQAAVGRETRMIELKREVNQLAQRLGEQPRYSLDFEKDVD